MRPVLIGIATIAAIIVAIAFYVVWHMTRDMPLQTGAGGIELREVAACGKDELPWSDPTKVEKVEVVGTTLKAIVLANATCGDVFPVEPVANVRGSDIELAWSWWTSPKGTAAACKCTRRIEFSIPNVNIEKPTVSIAPGNAKTH